MTPSSSVVVPIRPPNVLTADMDDYVRRVLARIPEDASGVLGVDVSNAGGAVNVGVRRGPASAVGFVGRMKDSGWTYGLRGQLVFWKNR